MPHHHIQRKAQQQREDLTGEHTISDAGQIVLACLFAATWITDTFFFQYSTFLNQYVPLELDRRFNHRLLCCMFAISSFPGRIIYAN